MSESKWGHVAADLEALVMVLLMLWVTYHSISQREWGWAAAAGLFALVRAIEHAADRIIRAIEGAK